jgi:hypothetical protein
VRARARRIRARGHSWDRVKGDLICLAHSLFALTMLLSFGLLSWEFGYYNGPIRTIGPIYLLLSVRRRGRGSKKLIFSILK